LNREFGGNETMDRNGNSRLFCRTMKLATAPVAPATEAKPEEKK
jgi:hypothetical protein